MGQDRTKLKEGGRIWIHLIKSRLLTLSLCRSYRDPIPSLFSKEVKSKQSSNGCVILRYGKVGWDRTGPS
jgi:murein L,D-transpeptidase YafK